jgi:hypothetical protein
LPGNSRRAAATGIYPHTLSRVKVSSGKANPVRILKCERPDIPKAMPGSSSRTSSCFRYAWYHGRKITMHKRRLIPATGSID